MLALGVLAAARITEKRWVAWGRPGKEIAEIFIPVVIAGVLGARVYHLFTGYSWDAEGLAGTYKIWEGGLSIWGAVAGGAIAVYRDGADQAPPVLDARRRDRARARRSRRRSAACGNYFNQELFGRPTNLPWGLEIELEHASAELSQLRRPSNRRSCTSRCGACSSRARSSGSNATGGYAAGRRSRSTCRCTRSGGSCSRRSGSIPRARSSAYASTCCSQSCCASPARSGSCGWGAGPTVPSPPSCADHGSDLRSPTADADAGAV